jgi:HEAT repeat protein
LVAAILIGLWAALLQVGQWFENWQYVQALSAAVRTGVPSAREAAARQLAQAGSDVSLPVFFEAARDERAEVRALAYQHLAMAGEPRSRLISALVEAARDGSEVVRVAAARGLGQLLVFRSLPAGRSAGGPSGPASEQRAAGLSALRTLLTDRFPTVRAAAANALGQCGADPATSAALRAAAADNDRTVRLAVAGSLLSLHGSCEIAARTIINLVTSASGASDRDAALDLLSRASPAVQDQAVAALVKLLSSDDSVLVRDVVESLTSLGTIARPALPLLERLLSDEDRGLSARAGMAIMSIQGQENPRSVALLQKMAADVSLPQEHRMTAVAALRGVSASLPAQATPDLIRQLGSSSPSVRRNALELLSEILNDTPALLPGPSSDSSEDVD